MITYEENKNDIGVKNAAIEFISYAETVGAIKEDSAFLRESLTKMFSKNSGVELEQFNRLTVDALEEKKATEDHNG